MISSASAPFNRRKTAVCSRIHSASASSEAPNGAACSRGEAVTRSAGASARGSREVEASGTPLTDVGVGWRRACRESHGHWKP